MGASNVHAAYARYAGKVPATSMQLLAFMAVVSKDDDAQPWYGQGHEALAVHARATASVRPEPRWEASEPTTSEIDFPVLAHQV